MNNKKKQNKQDKDINIKTIWKWLRSEKGKQYSFIIFYFFFFLFLFIFINAGRTTTNTNNNTNNITNNEESSLPFITKNLEQNNYNFKYIVKSNYDELLYKGIKNNNTITIIDDTGEHDFIYQNGKLESSYNILYKELFDIYSIKRIIKNSKLVSETKLNETEELIYNYKITNNNLNNILGNTITNLNLENEIIIKTDNKKEILEINYNLINYQKEFDNNLVDFSITLELGDLDE